MTIPALHDLVPHDVRRTWSAQGVYPDRPVFDLFDHHVQTHPDAPAVFDDSGMTTYGQLHDTVLRLASGLRRLGVRPRDVVACQLPNSVLACAVELATAALGAIVLPFPAGRGHRDIRSLLRRSEAVVTLIPDRYAEVDLVETMSRLRPELPALGEVVVAGRARDGFRALSDLLDEHPLNPGELPTVSPDEAVRYLVSSGTESEPKIVAYSHNALIGGRGQFLKRLQTSEGEPMRAMFLVPIGSSFGSCCTFGVLSTLGGSLVFQEKFDVDGAIRALREHRPTHVAGVPAMFQRMLASEELDSTDTSSLRALISGGSLVDPATVEQCVQRFGCAFVNLYGSADGVNCHTMLDDELAVAQDSVGHPNSKVCDVRIVDDDVRDVPAGEVGEVLARGPMSPMCYVADPELNERYRTPDGWTHTGDLGVIGADGRLRLKGRKKEIIIRGGLNISPAEVEGVIAGHPGVLSVACVPVADAELGQRMAVCVVPVSGGPEVTMPLLAAHLRREGLDPRKHPEHLIIREQFPLTPAGKIDKATLSKHAEDEIAEAGTPSGTPERRSGASGRLEGRALAEHLAERVRAFVDDAVVPVEPGLQETGPAATEILHKVQRLAMEEGLWGIAYPRELGGRGLSMNDYMVVAEQEGRSLFGPAVLGADNVVDVHMLDRYGSPAVRERFLEPLARGEIVASYGMTEPGRTGSQSSGIHTRAQREAGTWRLHGRKWFISQAGHASFTTVVARSGGLGRHPESGFSLIVVPTDAPGYDVVRSLPVLGRFSGQWEIALDGVEVPEEFLLGHAGAGMDVVRERLGLARLVRGMHWLGQARRGFDLMCGRLRDRRLLTGQLGDKQLMHQHVTESYLDISSAEALLGRAAGWLDSGRPNAVDFGAAKIAASRASENVLDRAVQVFGAEGLSEDTPLSAMYRAARATRIYDGADEVHVTSIAQRIMKSYSDSDRYDFRHAQHAPV